VTVGQDHVKGEGARVDAVKMVAGIALGELKLLRLDPAKWSLRKGFFELCCGLRADHWQKDH
jgi:hypothetical protein